MLRTPTIEREAIDTDWLVVLAIPLGVFQTCGLPGILAPRVYILSIKAFAIPVLTHHHHHFMEPRD